MRVLVDTSVWSLAFRRAAPQTRLYERELRELLREGRVVMMGVVRQELLSGIRDDAQFKQLRGKLRAFRDMGLEREDYEEAARCSNRCRSVGVLGSAVDFLICAVAIRRSLSILTQDGDFRHYAKVLDLKLHGARPELR